MRETNGLQKDPRTSSGPAVKRSCLDCTKRRIHDRTRSGSSNLLTSLQTRERPYMEQTADLDSAGRRLTQRLHEVVTRERLDLEGRLSRGNRRLAASCPLHVPPQPGSAQPHCVKNSPRLLIPAVGYVGLRCRRLRNGGVTRRIAHERHGLG